MPANPTPQELEEQNAKLLQDLEKPETPEPQEEVKDEENPVVESEKQVETPKDPEIEQEATPSPDYKEKFSQSSKEAQKVVAKNRKISQAIDEGSEITTPTDEEMKVSYPDWDELNDTSKKIAIEATISSKRFALIAKAREEGKKIEKWDEDVTKFTDNPQTLIDHPQLEGKIDIFKLYANEESHNSVPLEVLVNSFLFEQSKNAKPKSKGSMFPDGSGGPNDKPKKDKLSVAESEILRKTNYNEYKRQLQAGKISQEI